MNKEFIPYQQALELKELGFDEKCYRGYDKNEMLFYSEQENGHELNYNVGMNVSAPLYQQAFRWFREKYNFRYSIGNTNIAVVHYLGTTQLLQNNDSYEAAELAAIKWFIDVAKQQ